MRVILLLSIFLMSVFVRAQEQKDRRTNDLKVGLVLSGGGAKGLAHIGVLKVIDSLGVRIDYVSGTSMGAIVGSLYASGYSGKEIDSIFKSVNFDNIIIDNIPRQAKTYYERENSERYALTLPFDGFKLRLPTALSRGQNTFNLLSELTLHVKNISDFNELPIPFFCMTTNMETGQAVLLDKGNLAQAVMASGALPTLFQPVTIDDGVYIDGGVVNNYPLDEMKAKGVDLIIGVDVQDALSKSKDLKSATEILYQIQNYKTLSDMVKKIEKTDIYIKPDITNFNVISFDQGEDIIKNGVLAANKNIEALEDVVSKQHTHRKQQPLIKHLDSISINGIQIHGNETYTRAYILGKLKLKSNSKVKYSDFSSGVNNLIATSNFDNFTYDLRPSKNKPGYDLITHVKETTKKTALKLALHYDDLYKSAALVNVTTKRLLTNNDVMSFDLVLGDNLRYNFEYYIDKGFYWSIGVRSRFNQFNRNVSADILLRDEDSDLNKIDIELRDITNQFYIQTQFVNDMALSFGAEHKYLNISSETITDTPESSESTFENRSYYSGFAKVNYDSYDNKYFPKNGVYFNADFHWYFYATSNTTDFDQFSIAKADIGYAFKLSNKFSASLLAEGGFSIGGNESPFLNFTLGGYGGNLINNFKSFYGYDWLSVSGDAFVKSTFKIDYEFALKHHLTASANLANIENNLFSSGEWLTSPDYTGYALGYGWDSFLGPIEATYSFSPETKESVWFLNIGFWF
ncbi:patatin-like phospholipase family protein [Formosa algae]|uniref:NTE family protein n=1 Tax=Formosa algae TaxID=225843 RepID=A0A9X1C9I4_9FLAO|nr:patatin-like phospholipase family protein [Formosa algae]MBP1840318.1 NTE family protein [Formosa algae]MDQ0334182.1 NTE family protein [Formosa algae]OEI79523.1 patatin [Formosa algae]